MEKNGGGAKRDAVCDALESFLSILNRRTGRGAAAEPEKPKDGLLVLIRRKKKKPGTQPATDAGAPIKALTKGD